MSNQTLDFDDWFSTNYRRVLSSVVIVCAGDVPRAEDATNDAFLDALEKWPKVGTMDSPRAWVTKVAINKAKRSWLRRKRYVAPVNADSAELIQLDTTANAQATLTIWSGDSPREKFALLDLAGCGEYSFDVTHNPGPEGTITFTQTTVEKTSGTCDLTSDQTQALEALTRADYFAVTPWGVHLWDGPQPVAVFAAVEE